MTTIAPKASDLADIDVLSNAMYAEGVPHGLLDQLRRDRPIHFQHIPDERLFDAAWVLTRHEHVLEVSRNTDDFINGLAEPEAYVRSSFISEVKQLPVRVTRR
jgi:hypothetical protein